MAAHAHGISDTKSQKALTELLKRIRVGSIPELNRVKVLIDAYRSDGGAVIKVGVSALSQQLGPKIFEHIKILDALGVPLIIVHGGGKDIDDEMNRQGLPIRKINGRRVTDEKTVKVLKAVMSKIGFQITQSLIENDIDAQHLLGHGGILQVEQLSEELMYVGRVVEIKTRGILALAKEGMIPVITPLGFKEDHVYNINADSASSGIALSVRAKKIVFVTDVNGIHNGESWISNISLSGIKELMMSGKISGGMIPKAEAVIEAVTCGINASIINGAQDNALLAHLFGYNGCGTEIFL